MAKTNDDGGGPKKKKGKMAQASTPAKGLDFAKPPIVSCDEMFGDMVPRAVAKGLPGAISAVYRAINVATMCSGTESPILALQMISRKLQDLGFAPLEFVHKFSGEIVPFKQGYINSNFKPALLFQDITEFHPKPRDPTNAGGENNACDKKTQSGYDRAKFKDPEGTTVYGRKEKVPLDIDLLVAGSSCVDFSSLNVKKINDPKDRVEGQSATTFHAIVAYCQYAETPMVILENVKNTAAWRRLQDAFQDIGYKCVWTICDSKDYYLPQTRQRGYMICLNEAGFRRRNLDTAVFQNAGFDGQWKDLVKGFQHRASASVSDFLLTHSQLEDLLLHAEKGGGNRISISWENARGRHASVRQQYQLGPQSPFIQNPPEYAPELMYGRPHREQDVLSIRRLQAAAKAADDIYKMCVVQSHNLFNSHQVHHRYHPECRPRRKREAERNCRVHYAERGCLHHEPDSYGDGTRGSYHAGHTNGQDQIHNADGHGQEGPSRKCHVVS
jgi:site-specific DNA-cytosine methylase